MKISRYWHKTRGFARNPQGVIYEFTCWGGSSESPEAASAKAASRLARWSEIHSRGEYINEYEYFSGEIREELLREIPWPAGSGAEASAGSPVAGAVTRNRYGALILNTANLLIADIDAVDPTSSRAATGGLLTAVAGLFGRKTAEVQRPSGDKAARLEQVRAFSARFPGVGLRVYETAQGLRVFVTTHEFVPNTPESKGLLAELQSDPCYVNLCHVQQCYRARLTPKPWRCDWKSPPYKFPREHPRQQREFEEWRQEYERRCERYATCRHLADLGNIAATTPTAKVLLALHDAMTLRPGNAYPLA